jgi:hypothetical protein
LHRFFIIRQKKRESYKVDDMDLKELEIQDKFNTKKKVYEKRGRRIRKFAKKQKEREKDTRYGS